MHWCSVSLLYLKGTQTYFGLKYQSNASKYALFSLLLSFNLTLSLTWVLHRSQPGLPVKPLINSLTLGLMVKL